MRCDDCGRFLSAPASWAMIYDMVACEALYEHQRCKRCHDKYGPAQSNARPHNGDMSPYQGVS